MREISVGDCFVSGTAFGKVTEVYNNGTFLANILGYDKPAMFNEDLVDKWFPKNIQDTNFIY